MGMQRRAFLAAGLQTLTASLPLLSLGGVLTSLLAQGQQAFALGGTLPDLDAPAPNFNLPGVKPSPVNKGNTGDSEETQLQLADFAGQWLVLYFYPRDFTGGCTIEARGFQRDLAQFHAAGAEIVGISADDPESHADFCSSEGLVFPLLSDPGGAVSRAYGSWMAPYSLRHTFVIDPEGVLRARFVGVRPSGHSQEVLASLQALQAG
jgi:peroxiredoxin Q/BCP